MKKKTKLLMATLVVVVIVILFNYYKEQQYENARPHDYILRGQNKISYNDLEELQKYLDRTYVLQKNEDINEIVYTIKEDNLEEWYYNIVYTNEYHRTDHGTSQSFKWFIYDLITNNQYCYSKLDENMFPEKSVDRGLDMCYVSTGEAKSMKRSIIYDNSELGYSYLGSGQVVTSTGEVTTYSSSYTDQLLEGIGYAYIISQGENTPGYEEAMKWSYELAKKNGYKLDYDFFKRKYEYNVQTFKETIEKLNNLSLEEILKDYDEYEIALINIKGDLYL